MLLLSRIAAQICSASNKPSLKCRGIERMPAKEPQRRQLHALRYAAVSENDFVSALNMAHNRNSIAIVPLVIKSCFLPQHLYTLYAPAHSWSGRRRRHHHPAVRGTFASRISWSRLGNGITSQINPFSIKRLLFHRIRASAIFSPFARQIYSLKII